ncbi:MAG: dihydropyrimidinase [Solirubrobacteraceae bacterium]|nr:dihydropyrimidinase [Solirubrobacteraceae bacterium]
MSRTLITGGTVVTSTGSFVADVLAVDGTIARIGAELDFAADHVFDARGQYVIPGGIDVHTHVEIEFAGVRSTDDFTSASIAAAHGGTTTMLDFCFQEEGESFPSALARWKAALAAAPPVFDIGVHMVVRDLSSPSRVSELRALPAAGVSSFKLFMAYRGTFMVGDPAMWQTMRVAAETGALVMVHAENGDAVAALIDEAVAAGNLGLPWHARTRPPETEAEAVTRAMMFAELTGARTFIVHMSSALGAEALRAARARGLDVWGETCPQYLLLDDSILEGPPEDALRGIFSPPPRKVADQEALWTALRSGGLDLVSTDHQTFDLKHKLPKAHDFTQVANGGPSVEERLALVYEYGVRAGRISLEQWVELCCTAPARLFGMQGRKGEIAVGCDADIVIWDPDRPRTISVETAHSLGDYAMYEGFEVSGAPSVVLIAGAPMALDDPHGGFLHRIRSI